MYLPVIKSDVAMVMALIQNFTITAEIKVHSLAIFYVNMRTDT